MAAPAKEAKQTTTHKIALTGIKPSGTPHVGNYLGMIKPALKLAETFQAFYFIADYHALTTVNDPNLMKQYVYEIVATWLALGLNPDDVIFYRQSDIPEIFELTWVLSCYTPKGLLNRAHAYKASVDANREEGRDEDAGVNAGLFSYPVLMAADILMFNTEVVPVGQDQKQHIEITRDIAAAFNNNYGKDVLTLPDAHIVEDVATIPGIDGRKMSKSYGNVVPLFAPSKQLRKQIMRIVTNSQTPEEPKDPDVDNIYNIYKHFASPEDLAQVRKTYLEGGLAYGTMKQQLFEQLEATFGEARESYDAYMADTDTMDRILAEGAAKARDIATPMMHRVCKTIGMK
ncbi:MAG: tryptophan--tRNA ligase [Anaerolineaceae bacterium]|nr:tryptophan--tRNA ligase [Anaerolineaceae bacterium]